MTAGQGPEEIEVCITGELVCRRCGGLGLLHAHFPKQWVGRRGQIVNGHAAVVLCPACDGQEPAGAQLLALFAVDSRISDHNLPVFAELVAAWVGELSASTADPQQLEDEAEQHWRGQL